MVGHWMKKDIWTLYSSQYASSMVYRKFTNPGENVTEIRSDLTTKSIVRYLSTEILWLKLSSLHTSRKDGYTTNIGGH